MNIITVTVSPAIDAHFRSDGSSSGKDGSLELICRDSGGKGINLSRSLHVNGIESYCCVIVGEDNSDTFLSPLRDLGMDLIVETVPGTIRENANIHSPYGDTVIHTEGACVDITALLHLKKRLLPLISEDTYLCFCGSLPPKSDVSVFVDFLLEFKARGAKLIIDSRSFSYADIDKLHPYLIKPNRDELCELLSLENVGKCDLPRLAVQLQRDIADNVLVTLGKDGAFFASKDSLYKILPPLVKALSSTGAGDSAIAGFLAGLKRGYDIVEILRESIAYGTASCMRDGTLPPREEELSVIREKVEVEKIPHKM